METKKLYEIQIPVAPNEDNPLDERLTFVDKRGGLHSGIFSEAHHEEFLAHVKKFAHGYSRLPEVKGVWVNDEGKEFVEKMIPIRIATDEFYIDLLANLAKKHYEQEAIFVAELGQALFF